MTTIGKYRHLSRCSTAEGYFVVLAIDHRAPLAEALSRYAAHPVTDAELTAFKQQVIRAAADDVSAVLTDPAYGIGAGVAGRSIGGRVGLLAPVEVTNYEQNPDQRKIEFIPGWSVKKIKLAGGDGVKLLLPYHPESASAAEREAVVRRVVDECGQVDIPFFLEPITYSLDTSKPLSNLELKQITVEMAKRFSDMGADILKLHFPVDPHQSSDEHEWGAACEEVNAACAVPWTLLSAGVTFDVFVKQARIACAAGASGVIVGRAVWNEAVTHQGDARAEFIQTAVLDRMRELGAVCDTYATPWFERVTPPDAGVKWYEKYG
jgi:tagatose 1,6-diphosphate aldolase